MFLIDVTAVKPLINRRLELTFADGVRSIVALDDLIASYSGIFKPLLDNEFFQQVSVNPELGTITWPNGADLCPDVLYSRATGKPILLDL